MQPQYPNNFFVTPELITLARLLSSNLMKRIDRKFLDYKMHRFCIKKNLKSTIRFKTVSTKNKDSKILDRYKGIMVDDSILIMLSQN